MPLSKKKKKEINDPFSQHFLNFECLFENYSCLLFNTTKNVIIVKTNKMRFFFIQLMADSLT